MNDRFTLSEIGYTRIYDGIYKYLWISEVEHFVYLSRYGNELECLNCEFGFRDKEAQKFAFETVVQYGGAIYKSLKINDTDCFMRFPFWRLTEAHDIKYWMADDTESIISGLTYHLIPFVKSVRDRSNLFHLLVNDREPCPWIGVNGAMRAAQIAYLGKTLGHNPDSLMEELRQRASYVRRDLRPNYDVDEYLARTISDAAFKVLNR